MAEIPSKKLPFCEGLKVLVIDHDLTVLQNIEEMCIKCHYKVITCSTFQSALNHIRESDVILVELEMPNMDGYGFIQHIRKEVDVPIIAMSNNDSEDLRLKALVHGAWNYVKKPLHEEHITRLWQPVKRKASKESTLEEKFGNLENKHGNHDSAAAVQESQEGIMEDRKRNISPKDSDRDEPDDSYAPQVKKRRVVWDKELHNKFLEAVKKLEPDNAVVPKKILELMNEPNLTRENVASHLQKYRHQCKGKPDGTTREKQKGMPLSSNVSVTGEFIFQPLGGIRQVSYQTVAANPPHQWPNHSHAAEQGVSRNHPITRCPSNMSLDDQSRREAAWLPSNAAMRLNNSVGMQQGNHTSISMINTLQQQQQQQQLLMRQQQLLMLHGIQINPASVNQNCNFDPVVEIPGQSNNVRGIFHGYSDADAAAASIPQQGLANVAAPVLRSFPAAVSVTQFPESFNLAYDPNEIYMPTKPVEPETESNEEDEDDTRS